MSAQGVSDHGGNDSYTSSLNINVTMTPNMSMTVECYHDDGENPDLIGMPSTIMTAGTIHKFINLCTCTLKMTYSSMLVYM